MTRSRLQSCSVCHETALDELVPAALVREPVAALIRIDVPGWGAGQWICTTDLNRYRSTYLHTLLITDKGAVLDLEARVLASLNNQNVLSQNPNQVYTQQPSVGQRLADKIAKFGGSWNFIIGFGLFLMIWVVLNVLVLSVRAFDPYPFILLNLFLSALAALQAPVIMMSQNRLEARDRVRAEEDYRINLKAELEVRLLHEKVDHMLLHQWQHLLKIQELQLDLMQEQRLRTAAAD